MNDSTRSSENFRTSSHSAGNGECVEVGSRSPRHVVVRDSKDPAGAWLAVSESDWRKFVGQAKAGLKTSLSSGSLFGGDPDRVACREAEVAHGPAVGDGHRVELQVQLVGQVERHLLGPLRLDDALVLPEDPRLELLEHPVGLVEVVVAADDAVAAAVVGGDSGCEAKK